MIKEMTAKYSETFEIRTYETDFKSQVTPTALLGYMQEMATKHAELLGLGREDSMDHGFFWVLGRLKYDMKRIPLMGEQLEVRTWPAGVDGVCALRRFEFVIGDELVGQGFSYWLMLSTETYRMVKPDYFIEKTKDLGIPPEDHFRLKKAPVPSDLEAVYKKEIRQSDMDWNNHMNNTKYATLVYDALPTEFLESEDAAEMQVNYLREVKLGDQVEVFRAEANGRWHIVGKAAGKQVFTATVGMK